MQFKLTRTGFFTAEVKAHTDHCGTAVGYNQFKYDVVVEGTGELDTRGFVFDQLLIDQYFQGRKVVSRSCEWVALEALKALRAKIEADNKSVRLERIVLAISAAPYAAAIAMTWSSGGS